MTDPVKQAAGRARWEKHPWAAPCSWADMVRLYILEGLSQQETAAVLRVSLKAVQTALRHFKMPVRRAVKRNQFGEKNPSWKGSEAGYQAKHLRVSARRGKPSACDFCGTSDPELDYDWANLTGNYDDPEDFARLCRPCHRKYDNARCLCG